MEHPTLIMIPGSRTIHAGRGTTTACTGASGQRLGTLADDTWSTTMYVLLDFEAAPARLCTKCFTTVERTAYRGKWREH